MNDTMGHDQYLHCEKNLFMISKHNIFFFFQINLNNLFSSDNI